MITKGTSTTTSILARRPSLSTPRRELLLALPPAALLLAWLGLLLAGFGAIVAVIYSNADIVSAPVIGELYPREAAGATTTLGFLSWYSTLWFELATRWLPFHRQLWEVIPWLASVAGIALVAWSTAKAAGRWAGWLVAFVLVCAGDRLLPIQFGSGPYHGVTALHVCVLDAFLVLLVLRQGRIGSSTTHVLLCAAVAAATAGGLASDDLLIPAGLVPFVLAGLIQLRCAPGPIGRRIAITTVAVGAAAVAGAKIAIAAMHSVHTYAASNTITFAGWEDLVRNVERLIQSLAELFNGDFGGSTISSRSILTFGCALVLAGAIVVAFRIGRAQIDRLATSRPQVSAVREAHLDFWVSAVLATSAAFVFSSFAEVSGGRYLVAAAYGIVVLAAVGVADRGYGARTVGVLSACLVVTGSVVALAAGDIRGNSGHYPQRDFARFLTTFAQSEGLKYGYASYWVASALTWETKTRLEVYPVLPCSAPHGFCTYPLHVISSWYASRPRLRTFLIDDRRYGPGDPGNRIGGKNAVVTFGEYTIYVYDHDIAAELGDWRLYGVDAS